MYRKSVFVLFVLARFFYWTQSQGQSCLKGWFACEDGQCIQNYFVCDGEPDCESGKDEFDCDDRNKSIDTFKCPESNHYKCKQSRICVPESWICDGHTDCPLDDDEAHCSNVTCDGFLCKNKECIPKRWRCDGTNNCADKSDEADCKSEPKINSIRSEPNGTEGSLDPKVNVEDDEWTECYNQGKEFFGEGANCTLPSFYTTKCKEAFQEGCKQSETLSVCQNGKESAIKKWPCFGTYVGKPLMSATFRKCCRSCRSGLAAGKSGSCLDSAQNGTLFTECCSLASRKKSKVR